MAANPAILRKLGDFLHSRAGEIEGGKPSPTDSLLSIKDARTMNPVTGKPLNDKLRKSINVDPATVKSIIAHAKAKGIDPYDALAISYQETGIDRKAPFNLNPDYFKSNTGDAKYGVQTIVDQMKYAKNLQKRGVVPDNDTTRLQGYNGYGRIHAGHADLEGATSIYGYPIPHEGIDFMKNPLYGKAVISLRDEILKKHPGVKQLVDSTPAYSDTPAQPIASNNSLPAQIFQPTQLK